MWTRVARIALHAHRRGISAPISIQKSVLSSQEAHFPCLYFTPIRMMSEKRTKKTPLNEEIRAQSVTIVAEDGTRRENVDKRTAVREARQLGLDLVQVSLQPSENPNNPPRVICKMFDFCKKLHHDQRSAEPEIKLKGDKDVIYKASIEAHDAGVKTKRINGFLQKGHPVNLVVEWGNRIEKRPKGQALYERILEDIESPYTIAKSRTTNFAIRTRLNPVVKRAKKDDDQ